ncbi:Uncharacterised protein [uncultured archaeon]|nr:Uncharacterised protein [uncultured archaeon]
MTSPVQYELFPGSHPRSFEIEGWLNLERYLELTGERSARSLEQPLAEMRDRLAFMSRALGREDYDGNKTLGRLTFSQRAANTFYPECFFPTNWMQNCSELHSSHEIRPRAFVFEALKRNGDKTRVVAKRPKTNYSFSTNQEEIRQEYNRIITLRSHGVPTPKIYGIFEQGFEQYIFMEFVDGSLPQAVLKTSDRENLWGSDAKLLGKLAKAGYKHPYFYGKAGFEDKIWARNRLVLIDSDETFKITKRKLGWYVIDKEDVSKYCDGWLADCLNEYVSEKLMRKDEMIPYAEIALKTQGKDPAIAHEIVSRILDHEGEWQTEESWINMNSDCG